MRRFARKLQDLFGHQTTRRRPATRRLDVEALEQRSVPTAGNTSATVLGTTFIDANANGVVDAGERALPGAAVTLTGTTYLNTTLTVSTASDANGVYKFVNVPAGTYHLQFPSVAGFNAEGGGSLAITVARGQTVSRNLAFFPTASLTLRDFLTNSSAISSLASLPAPGQGLQAATGPTVKSAVANVTLAPSSNTAPAQMVDLAGVFTAPDLGNSTIRVTTNHGAFDVTLFDKQAPQYVNNFYDYINAGDYNNSVFTRLVSGFVLQGGGALFQPSGSNTGGLVPTADLSPTLASGKVAGVPNEVGTPNTLGTLSMAMTGSPNSATNEFFFNLGDNSNLLGPTGSSGAADGGFTVFGKVTSQSDLNALLALIKTPTQNLGENTSPAATALPGVDLTNVPLYSYAGGANSATFANDTTLSNFLAITNISVVQRPEVLTYSLVSNSNPSVLTATLTNERLTLTPQNTDGKSTITVKATDQYGNTATTSFTITVDNAPTTTVSLDNSTPNSGATVTATATPSDADHDPVSLTYVWKVNGKVVKTDTHSNIATATATPDTDAFTLTNVKAGATVTVTVTPNDGLLGGTAVTATATVNTPPVMTLLQLTPTNPTASSTIGVTVNATDANSDPITFKYVWTVNGHVVQTDASTANKADTLNPAADNITLHTGDVVKVTVTPNDGKIDGIPDSGTVTLK